MKVSLGIKDLGSDLIVSINSVLLETPIPAREVIYRDVVSSINPQGNYWVEKDICGVPVFCTEIPQLTNCVLGMTDSEGNNPYTTDSTAFVGGHPIHRPH